MQTAANSLQDSLMNHQIKLYSWANEISTASISTAAFVGVFGLTILIWFASRVVLVTGSAGYAKANSKYIVGLVICGVIWFAELYVLVAITSYVPPGVTKPPHYACMNLQRLDCILSSKGPNKAGHSRDCDFGQGPKCTITEPCTPCKVDEFMSDDVKERVRDKMGSCKQCELGSNNQTLSSCPAFVEGKGPYCYYRGITRVLELRDCGKCCYIANTTIVETVST